MDKGHQGIEFQPSFSHLFFQYLLGYPNRAKDEIGHVVVGPTLAGQATITLEGLIRPCRAGVSEN